MRLILKSAIGLVVVFLSFAFASELKAGTKEAAEKAMEKLQNHLEFFKVLDLNSFDRGPTSNLNQFELLFLKIEWDDERKQPKFAAQFDQILDNTLKAVEDTKYHEDGIRDTYMDALFESMFATTSYLDEDWNKCIAKCHRAEDHLEKLAFHLAKYPQNVEMARHASFRLYEFLGKAKKGKKSSQKSENKAQK